jgi:hypothetical protein
MPDTEKPRTLGDTGYKDKEAWSPFGEPDAQDPDPAVRNRFFGKYQGTVINNADPYQQGRLILNVPDVHGLLPSNWAMPCVALTDIAMGTFMRPRIGANVWVEFEQGDPQKPIWVGCFWGKFETPPMAKAANAVPPTNAVMTMETLLSGVSVCDIPIASAPVPGTVILRAGGVTATISLTPASVTTTAPTVTILAATAVNVTAPTVTVTAATAANVTAPVVNFTAATAFSVKAPAVSITTQHFTVAAPNFAVA